MSTLLAKLRHAGVAIALDGEFLSVHGADLAQQDAIKAAKAQIIATLTAEAFTGAQSWENSALMAGIESCYRQTADNCEFGCDPASCKALIDLLDGLLELPLGAAAARYLDILPQMKELQTRINESRRLMLEGRELYGATAHVFGAKSLAVSKPEREKINANIFA